MRTPTTEEVEAIAADLGISFDAGGAEGYAELVAGNLGSIEDVADMPKPQLAPRDYSYTDRGPGYQPDNEEDPYNAWITKCHVEGADDGPLDGLRVGLKDNISLAGIELTNGSEIMQGYTPAIDATIVSRPLEAGATIVGKNNMWSFSLGSSDYDPARNPAATEYSIGGSSSGTGSAVAAGEVNIGIGGDQAGSIRIPASFGGLVGMKPTHGLVPYTGIFGADPSQGHTGPLTQAVEDAARAMEVLVGYDGLDPRQPPDLSVGGYTDALETDISDMSLGVLTEGFDHEHSHPGINEIVHEAIVEIEGLGAEVTEVSVPIHRHSQAVHRAIGSYGVGQMLQHSGVGFGYQGYYNTGAMEAVGRSLDSMMSDLPAYLIGSVLTSEYLRWNYHATVYGKAQNITLEAREAYNEALSDVDALVAPTIPILPPESGDLRTMDTLLEDEERGAVIANTAIFDLTHHPAMTVPCGRVEGAPVGMMFVGERFDEPTLLHPGTLTNRLPRSDGVDSRTERRSGAVSRGVYRKIVDLDIF